MADYDDADDIKKLRKLRELKPETFKAFVDFDAAHVQRGKKAGASETEVAEAVFVAMALRAGGSWAHSCIAMQALEKS